MKVRELQEGDVVLGSDFFRILNQLSKTKISSVLDCQLLWDIYKKNKDYHVLIAEDSEVSNYNKVVGTGSIFIEQKFLRGGGRVGHIEDVVVDKNIRQKGAGKLITNSLIDIAKGCGCYKVILDCNSANVPFYDRCGFHISGHQMRIDLNGSV